MGARENAVVKACSEVLDILGIPHFRNNIGAIKKGPYFVRYGAVGYPDLIGVLPDGRFLGVEAKAPEVRGLWRKKPAGKRSPEQIAIHQKLARQGAMIITCTSSAEMMRDLESEGYGR